MANPVLEPKDATTFTLEEVELSPSIDATKVSKTIVNTGESQSSSVRDSLKSDIFSSVTSDTSEQSAKTLTGVSNNGNLSKPSRHSRASSQSSAGSRKRRKSSIRHSRDLTALPHTAPAQVYRNLLIAEESFREQYVEVCRSRRKLSVFFFLLALLTAYATWAVFIHPSVYTGVDAAHKLLWTVCSITAGLFYLTGLYRKAFVVSPLFIHNSNKGLRSFNLKLVKQPSISWRESFMRLVFDPVYSVSGGGGLVKLVLSARSFSSETIEAWELYRHDYWEREHHRAKLKK